MATLSRQPSEEEMSLFTAHLGKHSPSEKQKGLSDILWALLNNQARISQVTKGKGLEQRVMELT